MNDKTKKYLLPIMTASIIAFACFGIGNIFVDALDLSRVKTWVANETLTASDLNAEFNNILDHDISNADIAASAAIPGSKLNLAVPGAIGGTTPNTGTFTTLSSTGATTIGDAPADTVHFNANTITFEGATADANETTLSFADPTADITITVPATTSTLVITETNQTINGIKTFGNFSITPSSAPTTDYQVANKKYVDDSVAPVVVVGAACTQSPYTVTTVTTQAHGLGAIPTLVVIYLECLSDDLGYSVGDRVTFIHNEHATSGGFMVSRDATNVVIITPSYTTQYIFRKDTGAEAAITLAKWKIVAVPYLLS